MYEYVGPVSPSWQSPIHWDDVLVYKPCSLTCNSNIPSGTTSTTWMLLDARGIHSACILIIKLQLSHPYPGTGSLALSTSILDCDYVYNRNPFLDRSIRDAPFPFPFPLCSLYHFKPQSRLASPHVPRIQGRRADGVLVGKPRDEALQPETVSAVRRSTIPSPPQSAHILKKDEED